MRNLVVKRPFKAPYFDSNYDLHLVDVPEGTHAVVHEGTLELISIRPDGGNISIRYEHFNSFLEAI